tara:strand:+ start:907 stop:1137 length:231 start_codon:yes stop_codon:yes gene_type:complete
MDNDEMELEFLPQLLTLTKRFKDGDNNDFLICDLLLAASIETMHGVRQDKEEFMVKAGSMWEMISELHLDRPKYSN